MTKGQELCVMLEISLRVLPNSAVFFFLTIELVDY